MNHYTSAEQFLAAVSDEPVELFVRINGQEFRIGTAVPRQFNSGSFGWYLSAKAEPVVNGSPVRLQIGANLTVIGSKKLASGVEA